MKKILVVNNDIDTMSLLQNWLERKQYEVKFTGDGDAVPGIIEEFSPDLLLIDVLHSQVAEKLKTDESYKEIPLILMTGYTLPDQTKLLSAADEVIEKPFDPKFLEKKIEKFLRTTG